MGKKKPVLDVKYMMIDEHIYKIIEKNKEWFESYLSDLVKKSKKEIYQNIANVNKDLTSLKTKIDGGINALNKKVDSFVTVKKTKNAKGKENGKEKGASCSYEESGASC